MICDAVYDRPLRREAIEAVAARVGVPFHGVWLDADPAVLRKRVYERRGGVSDATIAVLESQLARGAGHIGWKVFYNCGSLGQAVAAIRKMIEKDLEADEEASADAAG